MNHSFIKTRALIVDYVKNCNTNHCCDIHHKVVVDNVTNHKSINHSSVNNQGIFIDNMTKLNDMNHSSDVIIEFWCLTPLLTIFQLYHGHQFMWWKKSEHPQRITDHRQPTGKLYHLRLRVECTLFVICTARREHTPY